VIVIVTGVAGAGKTTIGKRLASDLGWKFYDADDLHPPANIDKMRRGEPLDDADRAPWLASVREIIRAALDRRENAVIACSALKESYRTMLRVAPEVLFVYLRIDPPLAQERMARRAGHFFNPNLTASQFATLEEPTDVLQIDAALPPEEIVKEIRQRLAL
jgi:gluconokinase